MEKSIIIFVFICLFQVFIAQGQVNIPQISRSEVESSGTLQPNAEQLNISSITQLGNFNTAKLSQTEGSELIFSPNSLKSQSEQARFGDQHGARRRWLPIAKAFHHDESPGLPDRLRPHPPNRNRL